MNNLKPCPFCGGEAELCYGPGLGTDSCRGYTLLASCNECGAKSPGLWQEKKPEPNDQSWEGVADEWNSRPGEPDPENCGVAYCEHHRDGLPYCVDCEMESDQLREKLHSKLAEMEQAGETLESKLAGAEIALEQARAEIKRLKEKLRVEITENLEHLGNIRWYEEMELPKKNKLIEQMREALIAADGLIDEYAADYEHRDNVDEIREEIKAALAAERGE